MLKQSSSNTFRTISELAEVADVTPQTVRNWVSSGVVQHSFYAKETPIFTQAEFEKAAKIAKERKGAMNILQRKTG
jgi:hypothetical protein